MFIAENRGLVLCLLASWLDGLHLHHLPCPPTRSVDPRAGPAPGADSVAALADAVDRERYRRKSMSADQKDRLPEIDMRAELEREHRMAARKAEVRGLRAQGARS